MNDPENDFDTCCGEAGGVRTAPPHERRVCQCHAPTCANYLCAVCGFAVESHENLMIANPTIAGRLCDGCVDVEAAYHGLSVEEMRACRARLRTKRIAEDREHPGIREAVDRADAKTATPVPPARLTDPVILEPYFEMGRIEHRPDRRAFRPERVIPSPPQPYLERGGGVLVPAREGLRREPRVQCHCREFVWTLRRDVRDLQDGPSLVALSIYDNEPDILVQRSRINVQLRGTRTFIRDASRMEVAP